MILRNKKGEIVGYQFKEKKTKSPRLTEEQIKEIHQRMQELWDQMESKPKRIFDDVEEQKETE